MECHCGNAAKHSVRMGSLSTRDYEMATKNIWIEGSVLGEQMLLCFFRETISSEELSVGAVIERILKCM